MPRLRVLQGQEGQERARRRVRGFLGHRQRHHREGTLQGPRLPRTPNRCRSNSNKNNNCLLPQYETPGCGSTSSNRLTTRHSKQSASARRTSFLARLTATTLHR
ncbi:unnamed protein product [Ectocarpus sp. 4 AP-2014]